MAAESLIQSLMNPSDFFLLKFGLTETFNDLISAIEDLQTKGLNVTKFDWQCDFKPRPKCQKCKVYGEKIKLFAL